MNNVIRLRNETFKHLNEASEIIMEILVPYSLPFLEDYLDSNSIIDFCLRFFIDHKEILNEKRTKN